MRPVLAFIPVGGDTQAVTVGGDGTIGALSRRRGFISGVLGSVADGTSNLYGGAAITDLHWDENGGGGAQYLAFAVSGTVANSGWTTLTIGGQTFTRASASFATAGGQTAWQWPAATNPFNFTIGAVVPAVFS